MKREEKVKQTLDKIVENAIVLFGEKGYDATSIQDIGNRANISKGILYHYFVSKDELYLYCLKTVVDAFMSYSAQHKPREINIEYFSDVRTDFYKEYPQYKNIFKCIALETPSSLQPQIRDLKKDLRKLNTELYQSILEKITLGEGITEELASIFFNAIQYVIPLIFDIEGEDSHDVIKLFKIFTNGLQVDLD